MAVALNRELSTQIQLLSILSESPRVDPPVTAAGFGEIARRLLARFPAWGLLQVTDVKGNVIVTVPPQEAKQLAGSINDGKIEAVSSPVIGDVSKGLLGDFGFPVRVPVLRNGETVLELTAIIRPSEISTVLQQDGQGVGWQAWATDGAGAVVAALDTGAQTGQPARTYARMGKADAEEAMLPSGEIVRVASSAVGTTGWSVTAAMPVSEYRSLSWKTSLLLLVTCFATLVCSGVAILLFYREFVQRREQETTMANAQRMEALGKLTGQVAHDFNNLLMIFQAGANAIRRRPQDDSRVQQVLDSMLEGVTRGKEMTQRLLSFSRKSNQTAEVTDLIATLREVHPLLRQAANDTILVEYAVDPLLWPATIEAKSLEIALINLVTNAREAMPSGGEIILRARNVADARSESDRLSGAHVAITIRDTGTGITPGIIARIFEPLFTTKPGGAPGLGLAQVKNFAERSGGGVSVASITSVGTAITIYLPRAREAIAKPTGEGAATLPRRLLIVDDTPASLEAARISVEGDVVEVLTARSARDALEVLGARRDLDGLLSDIMMPGMSGIELAEISRRLLPNLRIVLMTGYSDRMEQGQKVDFPVVSKPFNQLELHAAFAQTLVNTVITGKFPMR
ncbi:ATP-binding protein [Rhizobium tubonense]|uniref:ATP-binding protein n=1 Tax=Rhizobium tubonense TaxID=484088 RepID=UPI0018A80658|nr:ATP-binding protein [Rhizobium tubonense]